MTTVRAFIAILATIVFGLPAAFATDYTWKGGAGNWSDAANWLEGNSPAAAYPISGSDTVTFTSEDCVVVFSNNVTIGGLTISSAGKHVFRTAEGISQSYTLKVENNNAKLAGAGGGTLVFDNITVDGKITDLANLKQLAIVGSAKVLPANSGTTDILLVDGGCISGGSENKVFGKLILQGGPSLISSGNSFSFTALEIRRGSGVSAAYVKSGKVTICDRSTVEMVGGTQTLDNPGPQIPVCTQFLIASGDETRYGHSLCTIDANGAIRKIPPETMLQSLEDATQYDNVNVTNYMTLTKSVTVNAMLYAGADIDLGENVVTVKSGQFRESGSMWTNRISNGTIRLCRQNVVADTTNNAEVRVRVDFQTEGVDDMLTPMLAHNAMNTGWAYKANYEGFTGVFSTPKSDSSMTRYYYLQSSTAPKAVLELRNITLTAQVGSVKSNLGGIAGDGYINFSWNGNKTHCNIWLGEMSKEDEACVADNTVDCSIMVGNKGVFAPGLIGYDGGRRGLIRVPYNETAPDTPVMRAFLMQEGGPFMTSINSDGTCGCLDASETKVEGKYLSVSLAGTLSVTAAGKIALGTPYPIIKYHEGMRTGKFASVTKGFRVQYDVRQDDGSYAVVVSRKNVGTVIKLR